MSNLRIRNKRLIYRYKICKRSELDVWGIFYRKQRMRNFNLRLQPFYIYKILLNNKKLFRRFLFMYCKKDLKRVLGWKVFKKYAKEGGLRNYNLKQIKGKLQGYLKWQLRKIKWKIFYKFQEKQTQDINNFNFLNSKYRKLKNKNLKNKKGFLENYYMWLMFQDSNNRSDYSFSFSKTEYYLSYFTSLSLKRSFIFSKIKYSKASIEKTKLKFSNLSKLKDKQIVFNKFIDSILFNNNFNKQIWFNKINNNKFINDFEKKSLINNLSIKYNYYSKFKNELNLDNSLLKFYNQNNLEDNYNKLFCNPLILSYNFYIQKQNNSQFINTKLSFNNFFKNLFTNYLPFSNNNSFKDLLLINNFFLSEFLKLKKLNNNKVNDFVESTVALTKKELIIKKYLKRKINQKEFKYKKAYNIFLNLSSSKFKNSNNLELIKNSIFLTSDFSSNKDQIVNSLLYYKLINKNLKNNQEILNLSNFFSVEDRSFCKNLVLTKNIKMNSKNLNNFLCLGLLDTFYSYNKSKSLLFKYCFNFYTLSKFNHLQNLKYLTFNKLYLNKSRIPVYYLHTLMNKKYNLFSLNKFIQNGNYNNFEKSKNNKYFNKNISKRNRNNKTKYVNYLSKTKIKNYSSNMSLERVINNYYNNNLNKLSNIKLHKYTSKITSSQKDNRSIVLNKNNLPYISNFYKLKNNKKSGTCFLPYKTYMFYKIKNKKLIALLTNNSLFKNKFIFLNLLKKNKFINAQLKYKFFSNLSFNLYLKLLKYNFSLNNNKEIISNFKNKLIVKKKIFNSQLYYSIFDNLNIETNLKISPIIFNYNFYNNQINSNIYFNSILLKNKNNNKNLNHRYRLNHNLSQLSLKYFEKRLRFSKNGVDNSKTYYKQKYLPKIYLYNSPFFLKNQKYFSLNLLTKRSQILKKKQKKHGITMFAYYQTIRWTFRRFYGNLSEKALKKICKRAYKLRGPILVNFMLMLETRLDIILYRSGFVNSIFEARQLINHGKFLVNGSVINKSSYLLKNGEILSIAPEYEQTLRQAIVKRIYSKSLIFTSIPYLEINYKTLKIMFIYDLFSLNSLKYNFKLNINDLNGVLYYYY